MHLLFSVYLKMLVLYSPFFVLSCFISLSRGFGPRDRKRMAWRVALAALIASVALYLFGRYIFILFGITADAFRIGAGSVLFISALGMAQGRAAVQSDNVQQDVTIVPLTIPLTVGPGTIGALLVMGVGQGWEAKLISPGGDLPRLPDARHHALSFRPHRTPAWRPGATDRQSPDGPVRLRTGGADHRHRPEGFAVPRLSAPA